MSVADVAKTLSGLLVVIAGLAGWLARRAGRELRPPDEDERAEVAEPLAGILVRHVGAAFLTEDLTDAVRAAAGTAAYVQTAPLTRPHRVRLNPAAPGPDGPDPEPGRPGPVVDDLQPI